MTLKDTPDVFIIKNEDFARIISSMKSIHGQKINRNLRLMKSIVIVFIEEHRYIRPSIIENYILRFDNIRTKLLYFSRDLSIYTTSYRIPTDNLMRTF